MAMEAYDSPLPEDNSSHTEISAEALESFIIFFYESAQIYTSAKWAMISLRWWSCGGARLQKVFFGSGISCFKNGVPICLKLYITFAKSKSQ